MFAAAAHAELAQRELDTQKAEWALERRELNAEVRHLQQHTQGAQPKGPVQGLQGALVDHKEQEQQEESLGRDASGEGTAS